MDKTFMVKIGGKMVETTIAEEGDYGPFGGGFTGPVGPHDWVDPNGVVWAGVAEWTDAQKSELLHVPIVKPPRAGYSTMEDLALISSGIKWAWQDRIPVGQLSMLVAEQDKGKSALLVRIAGSFICGWDLPDGTPFTGKTGRVVWCESEAMQVGHLERAQRWGIPLDRLIFPFDDPVADFSLDNKKHLEALARCAKMQDVVYIVVDSLGGATVRDWRESKMIIPVKAFAGILQDVNLPGTLSAHLRKKQLIDTGDGVALAQVSGNTSITQVARSVMAIDAPNPVLPGQMRLSWIKSNFCAKPDPIGFAWSENRLVFGNAPYAPRKETVAERAINLLKIILQNGPIEATLVEEEMKGAGISWDSAVRAKNDLGIVSKKDGKTGKWSWALPAFTPA